MEAFAKALSIAIPFFIGLIILESIIAHFKGKQVNRPMDTISSLSSGMTFTLKQLLGLSVIILSYEWMFEHIAIFHISYSWLVVVLAFVGLDFAGYWQHRFEHEINLFWNRHIIHHSSEEFNLACALRQNISTVFEIFFFLYIPMALIGIPPQVVAIVAPIHFFSQFWYHTRLIDKMGILEYIIVTPSHHRVHHAINDEYIDKNYSQIFIIWDRLFGTFQEELPDVPAVYGTKKAANTWNPVLINFQHLWQLIKDAWHANSYWDKVRIWFMPTGWRPDDVQKKYPLEIVEDVYNRPKYDTKYSKLFLGLIVIHFLIANVFQYFLLISMPGFEFSIFALCAVFLFVTIFAFTSLIEGHWISIPAEIAKLILGVVIIYNIHWLPIHHDIQGLLIILSSLYLAFSFISTLLYIRSKQLNLNQASIT